MGIKYNPKDGAGKFDFHKFVTMAGMVYVALYSVEKVLKGEMPFDISTGLGGGAGSGD